MLKFDQKLTKKNVLTFQKILKEKKEKEMNLYSSGSEFNTNGRFRFKTKLISGKPREDIRFSNTRISNEYNLEQIIIFIIYFVCHLMLFYLFPIPDRHHQYLSHIKLYILKNVKYYDDNNVKEKRKKT